jgi:protein TilB
LPQLKVLDGHEIKTSDRIRALQNYKQIVKTVEEKQSAYFKLREQQRAEFDERRAEIESGETGDTFWNEKSEFTPESRLEVHLQQEQQKKKEEEEKTKKQAEQNPMSVKKERKYFAEDGRPYSFNDPKVDYEYQDNDDDITLTVKAFKHLDSSMVDVDVQPFYVRVTLKGKALQLALSEEVKPGSSSAKRSQTTGHLVIHMPKVNQVVKPDVVKSEPEKKVKDKNSQEEEKDEQKRASVYLEVDDSKLKKADLANIVSDLESKRVELSKKKAVKARENSPGFVDNDNVPPLE